ncbi:MAG: hypothetical protein AAGH90_12700 [Pseudomonadota bacterium]
MSFPPELAFCDYSAIRKDDPSTGCTHNPLGSRRLDAQRLLAGLTEITSVKKAMVKTKKRAGLSGVTPQVLKHAAVTCAIQA